MKWYEKTAVLGTKRTVKKFLWLPKCVGVEWRWLEIAEWIESAEYSNYSAFAGYMPAPTKETVLFKWAATQWV